MDVGLLIALWRKSLGLSQQQLADAVGLSRAAIYQWEGTGGHHATPSLGSLMKVVTVFGITMEQFWRGPRTKKKAS